MLFLIILIQYQFHFILTSITFPNCWAIPNDQCLLFDGCTSSYCEGAINFAPSSVNTCPYVDPLSCQSNGCTWLGCSGLWQFWNAPTSCLNITDQDSCNNLYGCAWNAGSCNGGNLIVPNSCNVLTQNQCSLLLGCIWMGNTCAGNPISYKSCDQFSYADCPTGLGCSTGNQFCNMLPSLSCTFFMHEIECSTISSCKWRNGVCIGYISFATPINCSQLPLSSCSNMPGCSLVLGCAPQQCPDIISYEVCNYNPNCIWDRSACMWPPNLGFGGNSRIY